MSTVTTPSAEAELRRALAGLRLMHVLTVADSLRFLRGQITFMRSLGIEVSIACGAGPEVGSIAEREGARVHVVPLARSIAPGSDLRHVAALARTMRRTHVDLVHGHTPKGGLLGMLAAATARVPARLYHMRGLPFRTARGAKRSLLIGTERVSCGVAQRVVCNSHSLRRVAIEARLAPPSKLVVLGGGSGNGVDAAHYDPARYAPTRAERRAALGIPLDAVVVGFVGRFATDKGFRELAEAWRHVRQAAPNAYLALVGGTDERDPVPPALMAELEADPRVVFCGWTPDAAPFYAAMDVVTLPSYREGFPNVPLEAAAMALPVVTTDSEGCRDSVEDGVTGAVVPVRDGRALGTAIARYATDAALRAAHGAAGRARCLSDFAPRRIWGELGLHYADLLHRDVERVVHGGGGR